MVGDMTRNLPSAPAPTAGYARNLVEDLDPHVDIVVIVTDDPRGIGRVGQDAPPPAPAVNGRRGQRKPVTRQLARFAAIGVASTVVHLLLFVLLRGFLGPLGANFIALLLTALANTAANRRLTFGVRGRSGAARHQAKGLIVLGVGLALTTAALALLGVLAPNAGRAVEVLVLVLANAVATVVRFVLFRTWVFGGQAGTTQWPSRETVADPHP